MKIGMMLLALLLSSASWAEDVTVANFVRAESDTMFRANMSTFGVEIGRFFHAREPTTPQNQPVIRMNQDTLYSATVLDLSTPVTVTLPEIGGRYMSMHVVNQDHYMFVETQPGRYELTQENVGTPFAYVTLRTFVNPRDPEDIKAAHAAQDLVQIEGGGQGPFEAPDWNEEGLAAARKALSDLAVLGFDASFAFGTESQTRPVDHLVGAAAGWGGLPKSAAMYVIDSVSANDGKTPHAVTVKNVPVDAFWSLTVYDENGYLDDNAQGINSYNNVTAAPNADGSFTVNFGGCEDGRVNCIPITPGWNYAVRMYEPREEIRNGFWTFPKPEPVE